MSSDENGNGLAIIIGLLILAIFVWLTWYVCLWLAGATALYLILIWLKKRSAPIGRATSFARMRFGIVEGLGETMKCVVFGLAALTLIQLVANAWIWVSGPNSIFDDKITDALWSSEARLAELRRSLTALLSPRLTVVLLAAAVCLSVARPEWRPVKRLLGATGLAGRACKVMLVVTSASFFATEYAALHEDGFVQLRIGQMQRTRDRTVDALQHMIAWQWTAFQLSHATPEDRSNIDTLLRATEKSGHIEDVMHDEGARLATVWALKDPAPRNWHTPESEPGGKGQDASLGPPWVDGRQRSWTSILAMLRGPLEPWPSDETVAKAEREAKRIELRVAEVESATVEAAKLSLGSLFPKSLEPILRQFLKVTADAFSKTVVRDWFAKNHESIKEALGDPGATGQRVAATLLANLGRALRGNAPQDPRATTPGNDSTEAHATPSNTAIAERVHTNAAKAEARDVAEAKAQAERAKESGGFHGGYGRFGERSRFWEPGYGRSPGWEPHRAVKPIRSGFRGGRR